MMLCTENYPSVLAFCFLDELQKEFITTYNMMKTNTAVRPYCFIEFGKVLISFHAHFHTDSKAYLNRCAIHKAKTSKAVCSYASGGFGI